MLDLLHRSLSTQQNQCQSNRMLRKFRNFFHKRDEGSPFPSVIEKTPHTHRPGDDGDSPQNSIHFGESPSTPDTDILSQEDDSLSFSENPIEQKVAFYDDSELSQDAQILSDVMVTSSDKQESSKLNIVDAPFASLLKPRVRGDVSKSENAIGAGEASDESTSQQRSTIHNQQADDDATVRRREEFSIHEQDALLNMRQRQADLLQEIEAAVQIYSQQERELAAIAATQMERAAQHLESRNKFGAAMSMRKTKRLQQDQSQLQQTVEFLKQQKIELQFLDLHHTLSQEHPSLLTAAPSSTSFASDSASSLSSFVEVQQQVDQIFAQVAWKLVIAKSMAAKTSVQ